MSKPSFKLYLILLFIPKRMKLTLILSLSALRSISMFSSIMKWKKLQNFQFLSFFSFSVHLLDCYFLDFWFPIFKDNLLHLFLRWRYNLFIYLLLFFFFCQSHPSLYLWRYNLLYFNLFSKWQLHECLFLQTISSRIPTKKFNVWPSLLNPLFLKIYSFHLHI